MTDTTAVAAIITALGLILASVIPAMVNVSRRTKDMHAELTSNGGSSIKDGVDRIEQRVARIEAWNDQHEIRNTVFEEYVHDRINVILHKVTTAAGMASLRNEVAEKNDADARDRSSP